jgi:hypothetical protein
VTRSCGKALGARACLQHCGIVWALLAPIIHVSLAPDDSPLLLRDVATQEIYTLDWEVPRAPAPAEARPATYCNFTARPSLAEEQSAPFLRVLLGMSFQDPEVRTFMELEGVKQWVPARTSGYAQLERAVERFNLYRRP